MFMGNTTLFVDVRKVSCDDRTDFWMDLKSENYGCGIWELQNMILS